MCISDKIFVKLPSLSVYLGVFYTLSERGRVRKNNMQTSCVAQATFVHYWSGSHNFWMWFLWMYLKTYCGRIRYMFTLPNEILTVPQQGAQRLWHIVLSFFTQNIRLNFSSFNEYQQNKKNKTKLQPYATWEKISREKNANQNFKSQRISHSPLQQQLHSNSSLKKSRFPSL